MFKCLDRRTDHEIWLSFLGAFAKLRKATISRLLASSCLSARPSVHSVQLRSYWTGFHQIWYLSCLRKSVTKINFSLKWKEKRLLFMKTYVHLWWYLAAFFLELEMFHKKCRKNPNNFLWSVAISFFFKNRSVFQITWKNMIEPERRQIRIQYGASAQHSG
jgi:hypothetical protein